MALASAVAVLRAAVLSSLRLPASQKLGLTAAQATSCSAIRGFAGGAYLDKDEVTQRVLEVTKHFEKVEPKKVTHAADFKGLGLDSLDVVELVMAFEEEFAIEIPDSDADKIFSVSDAVDYIASHPQAK